MHLRWVTPSAYAAGYFHLLKMSPNRETPTWLLQTKYIPDEILSIYFKSADIQASL